MSAERIIRNARVVTREAEFAGTVRMAGGCIAGVDEGRSAIPAAEDWEGDYLLPGLVELHTDNLEKHLAPRPGVRWPALPAVLAHDGQLVASGITTVLDALALGDVAPGGARREQLHAMLEATQTARVGGLLRADHRLHLRCELSTAGLTDLFESLVDAPELELVSVMDHTPGQRQFLDEVKYREYYRGKYGLSETEMDAFAGRQKDNHLRYSDSNRRAVVAACRSRGIAIASHDDATSAHVAEAAGDGVAISEFPTTDQAARAARRSGLGIVMGAPNVVRGGSHSGNVAALELAKAGLLDGLSSDYVPASLLHAAFLLRDGADWSLPQAIATVSANPARMVGLEDRGDIAVGRRADLLRVRLHAGVPVVLAVWRGSNRLL